MEVKTAAWATVALIIASFGGVVIFAIERESIKSDLVKARAAFNGQQAMLDTRRKTLADRKSAYTLVQGRVAAIQEVTQRIKSQEDKNTQITKEIERLRGEWAGKRASFAKTIETVRQKTQDGTIPELVLGDGKILKSARFKEIKDKIAILEHTDGIARVPLDNMPVDWVGRLALGWNPTLSAELSGKADEPAPEAAPEAPVKTVEMMQAEQRASVNRADVTDAIAKIKTLERKIQEAERSRTNQLNIAEQYDYKYRVALSKGNANSHNVKRDEAKAIAETLSRQIEAAQQQIQSLSEQISKKQGASQ
jgi:hypothetical protein